MARTISAQEMQQIIKNCGDHGDYDHHYHCLHCGGKVSLAGHWPPNAPTYTCQPREHVAEYLLTKKP